VVVSHIVESRLNGNVPAPNPPVRGFPHFLTILILVVGCLLTVLLGWAASTANASNEHRLLKLQVRQAASALGAALPSLQTPLAAALEVAVATHDLAEFRTSISPDVKSTGPFVSVSLWQISPGPLRPLVVVGVQPDLLADGQAHAFLSRVHPSTVLSLTGILGGTKAPRVGYAEIPPGAGKTEVVYAETPLPANKKAVVPKSSAFADLGFALYLGNKVVKSNLIEATATGSGYHAAATVPFGDTALTLVGTATSPLGGGLSAALPWIVLFFGAVLAVAAAVIAEHLIRRRYVAELLAIENANLYVEQRTIAETLQHSLLPAEMPKCAGIEIGARYVPGVGGIDVGGDWYDVIPTVDGCVMLVVGDVSGRGLNAATTMASMRHAMRAYIAEGYSPAVVLAKLGELVGSAGDGQFATVLCMHVDVKQHLVSLASAGHFPPLLISRGGNHFVDVPISPPIGVSPRSEPQEVTTKVDAETCIVAFTDGLIERRGENLDVGLGRLLQLAAERTDEVEGLLGRLLAGLAPEGSGDDIAILGVQWQQ
jgi:serine phosphatase RsbU (regulator of sigma subunit)